MPMNLDTSGTLTDRKLAAEQVQFLLAGLVAEDWDETEKTVDERIEFWETVVQDLDRALATGNAILGVLYEFNEQIARASE